jgi:two-component system, cell cycle sensor histidine kinase and response regulator CckA
MKIFNIDPTVTPEHWDELWQKVCEDQIDTFESVHRHKNGTLFPVEISSNLLEFEGERFSISFVRDITARKNNAQQREKMEAHIRQAQRMDSLGTLAGGIAHDFNNILSAIIGYTELIQMGCQDNPKLQNYTSQLCVAGDRAKNLVKQILTFSRQGDSEKVPLDISRVINEALHLIRATVPSTVEILNAVRPNQGVVLANETQIHQIVMNLCTNAHHAMEKEGGLVGSGSCADHCRDP